MREGRKERGGGDKNTRKGERRKSREKRENVEGREGEGRRKEEQGKGRKERGERGEKEEDESKEEEEEEKEILRRKSIEEIVKGFDGKGGHVIEFGTIYLNRIDSLSNIQ